MEEYNEMLAQAGFGSVNVYYKDYRLQFSDIPDVLNWWSSAGLRPYLAALPNGAQEHFKEAFAEEFENNRTDKGIEFTFRRLFTFAEKRG
jgi:trans-aconitate methyltransferase